MTDRATTFAAMYGALHAAHHVADYWVQTDHQAGTKGKPGVAGRWACAKHVLSYTATTTLAAVAADRWLGLGIGWRRQFAAQAFSAVTHYAADRREHGALWWAARHLDPIAGKAAFLTTPGVRRCWIRRGTSGRLLYPRRSRPGVGGVADLSALDTVIRERLADPAAHATVDAAELTETVLAVLRLLAERDSAAEQPGMVTCAAVRDVIAGTLGVSGT